MKDKKAPFDRNFWQIGRNFVMKPKFLVWTENCYSSVPANTQKLPSLSCCPSGSQLSSSKKVVCFCEALHASGTLCAERSYPLYNAITRASFRKRECEEKEMVMATYYTLSHRYCSSGTLCHSAWGVQGRMQSPSSRGRLKRTSAAPALSSSARDYVAREVMPLSSPSKRAPSLVTPLSQEAAPSCRALA